MNGDRKTVGGVETITLPCCACDGKVSFATPDTTENPTFFHTIPYCTRFDNTNTADDVVQYMRDCGNAQRNQMRTKLTSLSELFDKPDGMFKWSTERNVDVEKLFGKKKRPSTRRSPTAGNRGQGSKWLHRTTRRRIYARDHWRCVWCQREVAQLGMRGVKGVSVDGVVFTDGLQLTQATIDHVVPRARGGSNRPSNLITCCMRCNTKRNHRSVPKFAKELCDGAGVTYDGFYFSPSKIVRRVRAAQRRKLEK